MPISQTSGLLRVLFFLVYRIWLDSCFPSATDTLPDLQNYSDMFEPSHTFSLWIPILIYATSFLKHVFWLTIWNASRGETWQHDRKDVVQSNSMIPNDIKSKQMQKRRILNTDTAIDQKHLKSYRFVGNLLFCLCKLGVLASLFLTLKDSWKSLNLVAVGSWFPLIIWSNYHMIRTATQNSASWKNIFFHIL